jgi:hypothetical protein
VFAGMMQASCSAALRGKSLVTMIRGKYKWACKKPIEDPIIEDEIGEFLK